MRILFSLKYVKWIIVHLVWRAGIFFFPFIEKLYPPFCSTMPASLPGWIAIIIVIRAKVEQKGRVFSVLGKKIQLFKCVIAFPLTLSLASEACFWYEGNGIIKFCVAHLIRGRKMISLTQNIFLVFVALFYESRNNGEIGE